MKMLRVAAQAVMIALVLMGCGCAPTIATTESSNMKPLPSPSEPGTAHAGQNVRLANGSSVVVPRDSELVLITRGGLVDRSDPTSIDLGGRLTLVPAGPQGMLWVYDSDSDFARDLETSRAGAVSAAGSDGPRIVRETLSDDSKFTAFVVRYPTQEYGMSIYVEPPNNTPLRFQVYVAESDPGFVGAEPSEMPLRFLRLMEFKGATR